LLRGLFTRVLTFLLVLRSVQFTDTIEVVVHQDNRAGERPL